MRNVMSNIGCKALGSNDLYLLAYMALNERGGGVNCLRWVFENFLRFNKILCMNSEQESS